MLAIHITGHLLLLRGGGAPLPANWGHVYGSRIILALSTGGVGVPIFFVISGFILSLPFARHYLENASPPQLGRYLRRRVTRIEPPYILALTAMYLVYGAPRSLLPNYLAGLVYLHKIIFGTMNPVNIVTWSLEVEVFFYVLAPWLASVYRIQPAALRRVLLLLTIALSTYWTHYWLIPHGPPRFNYTLASSITYFFAGMLLTDLYVSGALHLSQGPLQGIAWDVLAAGSGMALVYGAALNWRIQASAPFLIMLLFLGGMQGWLFRWFLRLKLITVIGGMCYTLYLWHVLILLWTGTWMMQWVPPSLALGRASLLYVCLMVPVIVISCAPLFYWIEKPFMNGPGSRYLERVIAKASTLLQRPARDRVSPGVLQ